MDLYDVIHGKKHKGPGTNEIVWLDTEQLQTARVHWNFHEKKKKKNRKRL